MNSNSHLHLPHLTWISHIRKKIISFHNSIMISDYFFLIWAFHKKVNLFRWGGVGDEKKTHFKIKFSYSLHISVSWGKTQDYTIRQATEMRCLCQKVGFTEQKRIIKKTWVRYILLWLVRHITVSRWRLKHQIGSSSFEQIKKCACWLMSTMQKNYILRFVKVKQRCQKRQKHAKIKEF